CCPPNIARLIASLGSYVYSVATGEVAVHLYVEGRGRMEVDGTSLTLTQTTRYPWDGAIAISVDPQEAADFALRLRIPGWCRAAELTVNAQPIDLSRVTERGYAMSDGDGRGAIKSSSHSACPSIVCMPIPMCAPTRGASPCGAARSCIVSRRSTIPRRCTGLSSRASGGSAANLRPVCLVVSRR